MTVTMDRREVLGGLAATTVLAPGLSAQAQTPDQVSFLVVGDWGRKGVNHQHEVAHQMETTAAAYKTRFIVSVGDNFYDDGVKSTSDPQWRSSFEDVYTGAHLQTPWYVALGNHDYGQSPQAQVDYTHISPRWRMPARYYTIPGSEIGYPAADLFILDTSPVVDADYSAQNPAAQLAWLDQALSASTAPMKLVFGHHTIYSGGILHGNTPAMIAQVLPILQKHRVLAYINGHDHDLQHIERDGLHFICSGAGAEARAVSPIDGTRFCAAQPGFAVMTLSARGLGFEFRDAPGARLYAADIPV